MASVDLFINFNGNVFRQFKSGSISKDMAKAERNLTVIKDYNQLMDKIEANPVIHDFFEELYGQRYEDRKLSDAEKKSISRKKKYYWNKQKQQTLNDGVRSMNFSEFSGKLETCLMRNAVKKGLVPYMVTYNFIKNYGSIPDGFERQRRIEEHYKFILSRSLGGRWHKHKQKHPVVILFPEYAPGELYCPHYHGIMWVHHSLGKTFDDPRFRQQLDADFKYRADRTNLQFHIQKIHTETCYVSDYCKKSAPSLPKQLRIDGHDMIVLPKSPQELQ